MERRTFLNSASSLLLSQLLIGCGNKQQKQQLQVMLLKGSIPGQIVGKFHQLKKSVELKFSPVGQISSLFEQLQTWKDKKNSPDEEQNWITGLFSWLPFFKKDSGVPDLVTLGDYWMKYAIEQKLIQPIDHISQFSHWEELDNKWKQLVKRNDKGEIDEQGKVWGAPYRWGTTVIIYRKDKFKELGWTPQDWSDLFKPELRSRVSVLDQPREVIGLVLKKLGKSYNTENLDAVPQLKSELKVLNKQIKFYSSDRYIEPLLIGDTWLAVGWSNDILSLISRYPELGVAIPKSGTALWVDLWVRPGEQSITKSNETKNTKDDLFYEWINFCWKPEITKQIAIITKTNSPISSNISMEDISEHLQKVLQGNSEILNKSEFLQPLSLQINQKYDSLFKVMKEG
ncbi:MAG: extracellular solute-binding protein [Cyanobacteria bacterium P01_A01_bin.84]